ncbi:MAG: hypothetical protein K8F91_13580, partial [Candidatus Obscuribacterales bacterium]|nr:hypothetical protein [Candidatus Obscuribacterales bacterium]
SFKSSNIIKSLEMSKYDYSVPQEIVTCETTIEVNLPIPVPGYGDIVFTARAVEPIVGVE